MHPAFAQLWYGRKSPDLCICRAECERKSCTFGKRLAYPAGPPNEQELTEIEEKLRDTRKQLKREKVHLDKANKMLEERLEEQRLLYEQLLADERAIQKAENEENMSSDAALQRELKYLSEEMMRLQVRPIHSVLSFQLLGGDSIVLVRCGGY